MCNEGGADRRRNRMYWHRRWSARARRDLVTLPDGVSEDALCLAAADADLLLVCYTSITARVIDAAAKLKGIVKYGVGDRLDRHTRRQCGAASPSSTYRNTPRRRSPRAHLQ